MASSQKHTPTQLSAALASLGPNRRRTGIERPRTPAEQAASRAAFKRSMQGLYVPRKSVKPLDTSGPGGIMGALVKVMGAPGIKEGLKAVRTPFSFVASHVADIGDEVLQGDVGGTLGAIAGTGAGLLAQPAAMAAGAVGAHGVADQLNKAAYENDQYVSDFKKQTGAGAYGQRAIDHFDPNRTSWLNTSESGKWLKRAGGLFGDIALDPLTYLKPGSHILSGTSEQVAGRIAAKIPGMEADAMAQVLAKGGDEAAQLAAKKAAREFGEGVMYKVGTKGKQTMSEADFWRIFPDEKFAPGMAWGLPGTGRVGRRVQRTLGVSEPKQIQWTVLGKDKANYITRLGGKPFRMVGKTKAFQALQDRTSGEYGPQIRGLLQEGDSFKFYKGLGLRKGVQNMRAAAASGLRMSTNDLDKFGMYSHLNIGEGDNIIGPTFGEILEKEVLPKFQKGMIDADVIRQIETGNITSEAAQAVDDFFKHIEYTLEQRGVIMGSRQNGGYVTRWLTDDAFDRIHHDLNIPDSLADPKASFANRAITPEDLGLAEDATPDLVRSTLKAKYGDDIFEESLPNILESYVRAADATHGRQVLLETLSAWGISFRAEDIAEAVSVAANQGVGRAMRMLNAGRPRNPSAPGGGGTPPVAGYPDRFDDGMALIYDYLMGTLPETRDKVSRLAALHARTGKLPGIQHTADLFGVSRRDAKMLLEMARHDLGVTSEVVGKTGMKALDAGPAPAPQAPSIYAPEAQMATGEGAIPMGPASSGTVARPMPAARQVPLVKVPAGTSSNVEIALRNAVDIIHRTGRKFTVGDLVDQLGVRLSKPEARQLRDLLAANAALVEKAAAEAEGVSKVVSMAVDGTLPSHAAIERNLGVGRHTARKWKQLAETELATAEPAAAAEATGTRRWRNLGDEPASGAPVDTNAPITPEEVAKVHAKGQDLNARGVKLHNDGQLPPQVTAKLQKLGKEINALRASEGYPSRQLLQREEALFAEFETIVNSHTPGFKPSIAQDGVGPAEWEYETFKTSQHPEIRAAMDQLETEYLDGWFELEDLDEIWVDRTDSLDGVEEMRARLQSLGDDFDGDGTQLAARENGEQAGADDYYEPSDYDTTDYPAADQVRTSNRPNDTADVGSVPSTGRSVKGLSDDEFVAVTRDIAQRLGPAERAEFWDELNAVNESPVFHNADGSTKWEEYDDAIDEIVNRYDLRPRPNPGGGPAGPPSNYDHFGGGLNPQANQRPPSGGRMGDDHLGIPDSSDDLFGRPRRGGNPTVVQEGAAPYETAQDIANRTLPPKLANRTAAEGSGLPRLDGSDVPRGKVGDTTGKTADWGDTGRPRLERVKRTPEDYANAAAADARVKDAVDSARAGARDASGVVAPDLKPKGSIQMTMGYEQKGSFEGLPGYGDSTMEASQSGKRTGTTRTDAGSIRTIKRLNNGDVVTLKGKPTYQGTETLDVRVTGRFSYHHKGSIMELTDLQTGEVTKPSYESFIREWSKREGWTEKFGREYFAKGPKGAMMHYTKLGEAGSVASKTPQMDALVAEDIAHLVERYFNVATEGRQYLNVKGGAVGGGGQKDAEAFLAHLFENADTAEGSTWRAMQKMQAEQPERFNSIVEHLKRLENDSYASMLAEERAYNLKMTSLDDVLATPGAEGRVLAGDPNYDVNSGHGYLTSDLARGESGRTLKQGADPEELARLQQELSDLSGPDNKMRAEDLDTAQRYIQDQIDEITDPVNVSGAVGPKELAPWRDIGAGTDNDFATLEKRMQSAVHEISIANERAHVMGDNTNMAIARETIQAGDNVKGGARTLKRIIDRFVARGVSKKKAIEKLYDVAMKTDEKAGITWTTGVYEESIAGKLHFLLQKSLEHGDTVPHPAISGALEEASKKLSNMIMMGSKEFDLVDQVIDDAINSLPEFPKGKMWDDAAKAEVAAKSAAEQEAIAAKAPRHLTPEEITQREFVNRIKTTVSESERLNVLDEEALVKAKAALEEHQYDAKLLAEQGIVPGHPDYPEELRKGLWSRDQAVKTLTNRIAKRTKAAEEALKEPGAEAALKTTRTARAAQTRRDDMPRWSPEEQRIIDKERIWGAADPVNRKLYEKLSLKHAAEVAQGDGVLGKSIDEFNVAVPEDGSAPLRQTKAQLEAGREVHMRENDIEHMMDNTDDIIKGCGE